MSSVKLNESALLALGFDPATVQALRHVLRQVGLQTGGITLPEVAGQADTLTPIVTNLGIVLTAALANIAELQAEDTNLPAPDNAILRRLDDLQADIERASLLNADLRRTVDDLASEVQALTIGNTTLQRRIDTLENGVN